MTGNLKQKTSKIVLIGGSGFIGTRLCNRLKDKHAVRIADKNPSPDFPQLCVTADVRDPESLRRTIPAANVIVNLAAEHRDDVRPLSLYDDVNVDGARNVCALAEEIGTQAIVFTSSVAVYGFAPANTDETGAIAPFNEYGRTKYLAEDVYREWQAKDPARSLVIIRPTVVFGERNRGNVFNLFRQIASGKFMMVGAGTNRKSMAYVGNITAFLEHMLSAGPGVHLCNYADKPDLTMTELASFVCNAMGRGYSPKFRLPVPVAMTVGRILDVAAAITGKQFVISAIRVKKFVAETSYAASIEKFDFTPPYTLPDAITRTVKFEFTEKNSHLSTFDTE